MPFDCQSPEFSYIPTFIGDENDVLKRYYECARVYEAQIIVRITADCPFIDIDALNIAIKFYLTHKYPYVCFAPFDGSDVEIFNMKMLKEAYLKATDLYDREHVTPYIRRKTKLSIDTLEDLKRARKYYAQLK